MSVAELSPPLQVDEHGAICGVKIPRYLVTKGGRLKRVPLRLQRLFTCRVCKTPLERGARFWSCPNSLEHTKAVSDRRLAYKLRRFLARHGYERWTGRFIVRVQRRVQHYRRVIDLAARRAQGPAAVAHQFAPLFHAEEMSHV
jgi:hypothetical protein